MQGFDGFFSLFLRQSDAAAMGDVGADTLNCCPVWAFDLIYHEEQTCCGQPAVSAGHLDAAREHCPKIYRNI